LRGITGAGRIVAHRKTYGFTTSDREATSGTDTSCGYCREMICADCPDNHSHYCTHACSVSDLLHDPTVGVGVSSETEEMLAACRNCPDGGRGVSKVGQRTKNHGVCDVVREGVVWGSAAW
jgi:hypothetical protein